MQCVKSNTPVFNANQKMRTHLQQLFELSSTCSEQNGDSI